jgi:hypothetical protein
VTENQHGRIVHRGTKGSNSLSSSGESAMETVHLAPNAQVSLYPWKDTPDKIPLAVRHIRTFLRAHRPVAAAQSMAAAAQ